MPNVMEVFGWRWMPAAGRLIWALIVMSVLLIPALVMIRRPKPDGPTTWAGSMLLAVYTFAILLLAYAVVPHEWITFADKYLQWGTDKYVLGIKSTHPIPGLGLNWPFNFTFQALRDVVVVAIYVVFFATNIAFFVMWQKRPTREQAERPVPVEVGMSRFGRPLRVKG